MPVRPLPRGGVVPFFVDRDATPRPTVALPRTEVRLAGLLGRHPEPGAVRRDLSSLGVGEPGMEATLELRNGRRVVLS